MQRTMDELQQKLEESKKELKKFDKGCWILFRNWCWSLSYFSIQDDYYHLHVGL